MKHKNTNGNAVSSNCRVVPVCLWTQCIRDRSVHRLNVMYLDIICKDREIFSWKKWMGSYCTTGLIIHCVPSFSGLELNNKYTVSQKQNLLPPEINENYYQGTISRRPVAHRRCINHTWFLQPDL